MTRQEVKQELKRLAALIRQLKSQRKALPFGFVPGLTMAQLDYRHLHICSCLLRGRTIEQIEPRGTAANPRSVYRLNQAWTKIVGLPYPDREVADASLRTGA